MATSGNDTARERSMRWFLSFTLALLTPCWVSAGAFEVEALGGGQRILTEIEGETVSFEGMIGGGFGYYPARAHRLGVRYSRAFYARESVSSFSFDYRHLFGAESSLSPYVGFGFGSQSRGAVDDGTKMFFFGELGMKRLIAEGASVFAEARGIGVGDRDRDDARQNTAWVEIVVGFSLGFGAGN